MTTAPHDNTQSEQRRSGRPRLPKADKRVRMSITLAPDVFAALQAVTPNRAAFIEDCLRRDARIAAKLGASE